MVNLVLQLHATRMTRINNGQNIDEVSEGEFVVLNAETKVNEKISCFPE